MDKPPPRGPKWLSGAVVFWGRRQAAVRFGFFGFLLLGEWLLAAGLSLFGGKKRRKNRRIGTAGPFRFLFGHEKEGATGRRPFPKKPPTKKDGKIPSLHVKPENYTRFYISQYPGQGISRSPAAFPSTRAKSCRSRRMPISALTRRRMYRGASPRNMPTL